MEKLPSHKEKLVRPQALRLTDEASKRIDTACEAMQLARQDTLRLLIDIGLAHLEAVKYDLAKAVLNESGRLKK